MLPASKEIARRDAVRRSIGNREKLIKFACRGAGQPGSPTVAAPLADPWARSGDEYIKIIDSALRLVLFSMLEGTSEAEAKIRSQKQFSEFDEALECNLSYLRDRIGVPRDMTIHAAQQFRAHINWLLKEVAAEKK